MIGRIAWSALALAAASGGAVASPQSAEAGLHAEHLYNGVQRPARITVTSPRSFGTVSLALMEFDGKPLAEPISVHPGIVDLDEALPQIWDLRRTAYLQLLDGERPVGSALVLQPMLSRMVPVTEVKPHPTRGTLHTSIVGWIDENDPSMQAPPQEKEKVQSPTEQSPKPLAPGSAGGTATASNEVSPDSNPKSKIEDPQSIERLFTGLRIYPERDVILHTTHGDIRLAMKPDEAPNTVWSFLELAGGGFYRNIQFHRIVPLTTSTPPFPFVIQAGDPTATGDGGPGYWLPIEDSKLPHDFGVISMARSDDPDSNGSQFFIALSREGTARLDGQYCAFGYAVEGAAAIMAIAQVPLADVAAGKPVDPPLIKNVELVPAPSRAPGSGRPDQRVTPETKPAEPKPTGRIPR